MKNLDATELLTQSRHLLLDRVLGEVPESLRYDVRMIASAMAMSVREINHNAELAETETRELAAILGSPEHQYSKPGELRRALALAIRSGRFDPSGGRWDHLLHSMRTITSARLRISNPRVMNPTTLEMT